MANFTVNSQILEKYLPVKTQHDRWKNQCYVSLVGFMFMNTSILGIKFPFHANFEEVNLITRIIPSPSLLVVRL